MGHLYEYEHLDDSAIEAMMDEREAEGGDTQELEDVLNARHEGVEAGDLIPGVDFLTTYEEHQAEVSSWVKRNLDGAQYAQPRGSQYEG